MLDAVELAVQWAAVSTCCEEIRVPPHLDTQLKYLSSHQIFFSRKYFQFQILTKE